MTSWQTLFDAALLAHRDDPTSRFVPFATVGVDGAPRNRWMVFRGFGQDGALLFVTDGASAKIAELEADARCEAAFYFRETREQFRIAGEIEIQRAGPERLRLWESLSPEARHLFLPDSDIGARMTAAAPESFVALGLKPGDVDYLDLRTWPHLHHVWEKQRPLISRMARIVAVGRCPFRFVRSFRGS